MNTAFLNAKNDFLAAAKRTYESGIQTGTGGNLSVRIPGENLMIVKPSGFSYGQCTEDNLCITDFDGNVVMGGKPTRESTLHGNLYKRYPQIGGIVHTHSPYAILNSLNFSQALTIIVHTMASSTLEAHIARIPMCSEHTPPIPAPIANIRIIP